MHDGHSHVWIDTICIDKSSSAELSEAINSMYRWYENAEVCYISLADVPASFYSVDDFGVADFRKSRWCTRGWTLQELLASRRKEFFNMTWGKIAVVGQKEFPDMILRTPPVVRRKEHFNTSWGLNAVLEGYEAFATPFVLLLKEMTKIPCAYLTSPWDILNLPVCQKMAWAAHQQTTRPEDQAYCLLGVVWPQHAASLRGRYQGFHATTRADHASHW